MGVRIMERTLVVVSYPPHGFIITTSSYENFEVVE
jgi:hypothetical protein